MRAQGDWDRVIIQGQTRGGRAHFPDSRGEEEEKGVRLEGVGWVRCACWGLGIETALLFSSKMSSQQKVDASPHGVRVENPPTAEPVNRQIIHHTLLGD